MEEAPFVDFIRDFVESLPPGYRNRHDANSVVEHARLSYRRGDNRVAVGTFTSNRSGMAICVVANDRPGLLSLLAAACVVARLDVVACEAYNRTRDDGSVEAVDLFWVRSAGEADDNVWISPSDIANFRSALVVLMDGTFDRRTLVDHVSRTEDPTTFGRTRVRLVEGAGQTLTGLDVETIDRPGLLFALTDVLFQLRLQIVRSEVRTVAGRVFDRFHFVDQTGEPVHRSRGSQISQAVYARLLPRHGSGERQPMRVQFDSLSVQVG